MSHPIESLQRHARDLDQAFLRITTLRALLATGQHEVVEHAVGELEDAVLAADASGTEIVEYLNRNGYERVEDLADASPDGPLVLRTWGAISTRTRNLANALVATRTQADAVLRHLDTARSDGPTRQRGPHAGRFMVAEV